MDVPETQYARNGDVTIAYQVFGHGPPTVWVPGFISHVELNWEAPFFARAYGRGAEYSRLLTFDKRGTGLSDHSAAFGSFEERVSDVVAVMDAAGFDRATVGGISEGGPLALLLAATHPQRVERLVLFNTFARFSPAPGYQGRMQRPETFDLVEQAWGTGEILKQFTQYAPDPEVEQRLMAKFERYTATPRQARHILSLIDEIDVRAILPSVQVPTLVIHCKGDPMVPVRMGRYLAEHLPNCVRYLELDRDFHASWLPEDTDLFVDAVEEFITGTITSRPVSGERVLGTVLFTDIVDSTVLARSAGDREWRRTLDGHDDRCAEEVRAHRGRLIKSTGDGILALFDGPARAVQCARRISTRVQPLGLQVRSGLHAGECDLRGDDVSGIAVHVAARVMGAAGPGEVLVTSTVKDLALGSGLTFEPLGPREFKGLDEPLAVYRAT